MRHPLITVLIASVLLTLDAAAARAADLVQLYQQALANDATYAVARDALAASQQKTTQGRAGLLPPLQASGQNTRNTGRQLTSFDALYGFPPGTSPGEFVESDSQYHLNTYTVSLTQPLYNWASWQQYQQSKLFQAAAEADFAQAQEDLITRVAQAYFDVLTAQDNLSVTRSQKSATTEQLASAKRNHEIGTQTITDADEAQAAFDQVVAQEFAAINDLGNKRAALRAIIGGKAPELAPLRPGVTVSAPEPDAIEPWVDAAETQNYAVVGAELGLEVAKRQIQVDRAGHMPTAALTASKTHNYQTGYGTNNSNAIGVSWSVPLFSGFAVTSKVRESIALESRARNELEAARRNAALSATEAFLGVNSGLAQVRALEAAEVSSRTALKSNKLGYQVGVRINIDVLNAQKLLYATQKDLSKARYDTIMNGLRLKAAAGTLRPTDLGPINALLAH
ncbi:TolC family outer membrane protein [Rugamonas sp.]|uniref:TolC family outer membrane protein n=1 Tax=Rugamonas sp. TaxID=1926287 RepID=UPI0025F4C7DF|nr:TolC family outer membrane protein [Rugamonas sp.]